MKEINMERAYPENTIGYHYRLCLIVFGEESKATRYLQDLAEKSPNGFEEGIVAHESQVLYILRSLHAEWIEEKLKEGK